MIERRLLIVGYYGYRNWGDEAALVVLVERLREMQWITSRCPLW
jgi:polysaccharide pyruvyl transferase WcaK-like protein